MQENPLFIVIMAVACGYVFKIWLEDYRGAATGKPNPKALPGATAVARPWVWIGVAGALVLVGVETAGEYALGVSAEQKTITWIFLLAMIAAGFVEELVFRGFLFVDGRGKAVLWASIVGFSLLFALLHFQYYLEWAEEAAWYDFAFKADAKSAWTLLLLFLNSLWFYWLRFGARNAQRSLIPCFAAHIASNLGVFVVKLAQGHVQGLW